MGGNGFAASRQNGRSIKVGRKPPTESESGCRARTTGRLAATVKITARIAYDCARLKLLFVGEPPDSRQTVADAVWRDFFCLSNGNGFDWLFFSVAYSARFDTVEKGSLPYDLPSVPVSAKDRRRKILQQLRRSAVNAVFSPKEDRQKVRLGDRVSCPGWSFLFWLSSFTDCQ